MAKASIRDRLAELENQRRFLDWFVMHRFWDTLSREELETFAAGGGLPDPVPNRPSIVDTLDRKSLLKLWEANERTYEGRNHEEMEFYADNGFWPEQKGRLHYFLENGKLNVEWQAWQEKALRPETRAHEGPDSRFHFGGANVTFK